jgi:quinol monooxygenase YgiN
MVRHIVLFKLKPGLDEQTVRAHIADFAGLAATVPAIETIEVQRDVVGRDVSSDFGLVVSFADLDALKTYQAHPDHQAAFARLKPNLDHMLVLDYHVST